MEATITSKGQITIPKLLRDIWHLKIGDKILFEQTETGECIIRPRGCDVQSLRGFIPYKGKPVSLDAMEQAIADNSKGIS